MTEVAVETLAEELDAAIRDLETYDGSARCEAHQPLARAMIVLLRSRKIELRAEARRDAAAGKVAAWVSGIISAVVSAVAAWFSRAGA